MSSKSKSITELVNDLQQENESLKRLEKIANQYTKLEFGYSVKELHQIIEKFSCYERDKNNNSNYKPISHFNENECEQHVSNAIED